MVGGGLAGLAAAVALQREGVRVELFERSRLLGGRATSFEIDGVEVDNGQHVFLACCTEFIDFVDSVGMRDALYLQDRFDALVFGGGVASRLRATSLPAPFHLLPSLLTYRHLSVRERIRFLAGIARMLYRVAPRTHRQSFAAFLAQNRQRAPQMRAFWEPFFIPALNAPLDCVSQDDGEFVLARAFLRDARAARFGWSRVPLAHIADAAARRLDSVHLSTAVNEVRIGSDTRIELRVKDLWHSFDAAVLAVTPPQLARLLDNPERYGARGTGAYRAYPIVDVHLWHDRSRLDFEFAALIDSPVQWIFAKAPGYLCCSMSAADALAGRTTTELTQRAWQDVVRNVPAMRTATLQRSAVTRSPDATYVARFDAARTQTSTVAANLAIAGSWTDTGWPDTMESAVRSGRAAAKSLQFAPNAATRDAVSYAS